MEESRDFSPVACKKVGLNLVPEVGVLAVFSTFISLLILLAALVKQLLICIGTDSLHPACEEVDPAVVGS